MFWLVDSDNFPVWLHRVTEQEAADWIERGEAKNKLPAAAFDLVWAKRHGVPARWYLFPHEDNRPGLVIYEPGYFRKEGETFLAAKEN